MAHITKPKPRVSYTVFEQAAQELGISGHELVQSIGYSRYSHLAWREAGAMPKVAAMAVECIMYRNNHTGSDHKTFIVKLPNDKMDALVGVLSAFNCTYQEV